MKFLTLYTAAAAAAAAAAASAASAVQAMSPPAHHPIHRAPRELLGRIRKSNPAALDFAAPSLNVQHQRRVRSTSSESVSDGLRVTPTAFGGDPTGQKDSWEALNACLERCLNQSALSPNGFFPGQDTIPQFGPIRDMGGCNIDLDGGEYRISKPLVLPEMNANMQFGRGSLVAAPDFVGDFLFVVGVEGSCKYPQGSCNIDINFPELFVDGAGVASGMQINNVMGVTIGPGGYFLNFTEYGVQINDGHEVMMDRCWLGETNFDFDHVARKAPPNATAIQINGNDHYILNSIIFSSKVGIEVHGAADYVSGVHVWFPDNNAVAFANTAAFHVFGGGNRFNGCYIDGGRAIFEGGALSRNVWTNGFECCQGAAAVEGTTASGITLVGAKVGAGLQIMNNEFGGGQVYQIDELWPSFNTASTFEETLTSGRDCQSEFNISAASHECIGLQESAPGSASLQACAAACCSDVTCSVYQFCAQGGKCDGATGTDAQCWLGQWSSCDAGTRQGWQGMADGGSQQLQISGVRISHNSFGGAGKGSAATLSLSQKNATTWDFDFCSSLIFPQIAHVNVNLVAESGFPVAVARPPSGCHVTVETSVPVTGTMHVTADSSEPDAGFI